MHYLDALLGMLLIFNFAITGLIISINNNFKKISLVSINYILLP